MRKSIGVKVFTLVIVLAVLFFANCMMNNAALKDMASCIGEMFEVYIPMKDVKGDMEADFTNLKLLANLAVLMPNREMAGSIAEELEGEAANVTAELDKMQALCDKDGDPKLADTFQAYRANVEQFIAAVPEIKEKVLAGDLAGAQAAIDSQYEGIMANDEILASFEEMLGARVAKAENHITIKINGTIVFSYLVLAVYIILVIVVVLIVLKTVVKPAKNANNHLQSIIEKIDQNEGDLTERIPVKTKDEVGQLVAGVNGFIAHLQDIMKKIQVESANMMSAVEATMENVNESNSNAENVSATMEELAASMEEVSATLDEIATGSRDIVKAVQDMNGEADEGTELVQEIKQRAEKINQDTIENKQTTDHMAKDIRGLVEAAVEESRSVEKINELTGDILDISSQTNLLALNASIEAARAGEAGKGFAVVADEIRVLADNSRDTANNIQSISQLVTDAVEKLAKNAVDMLQFIEQKVLKDYDSFVEVANQYHDDADNMNEILQGFAQSTADMEATMRRMNEGISEISTTVDESARGVANAAENAGQLVDAISHIQEETRNNQEISDQLSQEVKRFKNV